ncbi:MAG: nickel-dependent lactate racemase family protein [Armatimonadota bacterium]
MRIKMCYGKSGLYLDLPDEIKADVITKKPMPILDDPHHAIEDALMQPVGSGTLADAAYGCQTACILVCDITRPVPNGMILPLLVNQLIDAGMSADNITILVATGLHRPNEGQELEELIGDRSIFDLIKVENHFARCDEDHRFLGYTKRGTPVKIDRRFVDADLRIVTGLVEPHFMAGYSGGRKVIAPGIAHAETITRLHSADFLEDQRTVNCILAGNPLHEELLEIANMIGDVLAVNTVIDEERRLSYVNFGELVDSHNAAIEFLKDYAGVRVHRRYHTVVTSAAGYPLDKTYYQTVKGMVSASDLVVPGGDLFIVSECSEGLGSHEFIQSQKCLIESGADMFLKSICCKKHADIDEWETEMLLRSMKSANIHLCSNGLCDADHALTGVNKVELLEEAVLKSVERSGNTNIAVIPEGPYVYPEVVMEDDS